MATITHDGKEYILKSQVEEIIKDRVSKVAQKANDYQSQYTELKQQFDSQSSKIGTVDLLTNQIEELTQKLTKSERKYKRHTSIAKYGLTDPELVAGVEFCYERKMQSLPKKERVELSDWLDNHISNPETAPALLRPHIQGLGNPAAEQPGPQNTTPQAAEQPTRPAQQYPSTNSGARPAPDQGDILQRALKDPELYRQNRDKIKEIWNSRARKGLR